MHPLRSWSRWSPVCLAGLLGLALQLRAAEEASPSADKPARSPGQAELEALNPLIGGWRGFAQPIRNSTEGAWPEKAEWVWDFQQKTAALRYEVKGGQLLESVRLTFDPEAKEYQAWAKFKEGLERTYTGTLQQKKLILESPADREGIVHRLTITMLNPKRTLVLLEKRPEALDRYTRVVEVGYTREGTSLAVEGAGEPKCIVSGGKGTMSLVYKGKTYWFCCTGCRDAFRDNPEGFLK